jgi:hypothetical protein
MPIGARLLNREHTALNMNGVSLRPNVARADNREGEGVSPVVADTFLALLGV